jgi:hypothetical protein
VMESRGSGSLTITSGADTSLHITTGITTGTSQPAGQVDGPLRIDVDYTKGKGYSFTIDGYLNYGDGGGSGAVPTTTTLSELPRASADQPVTYLATVKQTSSLSDTYGSFRFSFPAGKARQSDNCRRAHEDDSGRASCTLTFRGPGTFPVTASFAGTQDRQPSSASVQQVIDDLPYATVQPTTLTFAFHSSLAQSVTVSSPPRGKLVVTNVAIEGSGFSVSGENCTGASPARPCTILVQPPKSPGAVGSSQARLVITDNASNSPQIVDLSGG